MPQPLVDLVRHQESESCQIGDANLELHHDPLFLDKELGNRRSAHLLVPNDRVRTGEARDKEFAKKEQQQYAYGQFPRRFEGR